MKLLGRLIGVVLWLGLSATVAWNAWQIQSLRGELDALKRSRGVATPSRPSPVSSLELLGVSRRHAERAQALVKAGRLAEARKELSLAAETAQRAGDGLSHPDSDGLRADLQRAAASLSEKAGALWESGNAAHRQEGTGASPAPKKPASKPGSAVKKTGEHQ